MCRGVCVCVCVCVDKIDSKKACKQVPGGWASLVAQTVKNASAAQETQILALGRSPGEGHGNPPILKVKLSLC